MELLSSRDNPRVKHLRALGSSARDRRKFGETILDGAHLIEAACQAGMPLKAVFVSPSGMENQEIADLVAALPATVPVTALVDVLFAHVSPVDTPSGILALIDLPGGTTRLPDASVSLIVLDAVQDPGNLGTILRTAAAAGIGTAWLTPGCAQAWSPRVLRAGMGAHFRIDIAEQVDALQALAGFSGKVLATGLSETACSLYALDLNGPIAWLFGAEGLGVSPALFERADQIVTIPMAAGIESLNVGAAAAVCLFEQYRQRKSP
ncbi:RNA methyltransferase [Azoarcus sp. L1K30]|nr:RNA methyltransferase [Azoarcus sp. L1K30]MBR0565244.1 RNA methyltransferase [Azoarcus sp. L1K30]